MKRKFIFLALVSLFLLVVACTKAEVITPYRAPYCETGKLKSQVFTGHQRNAKAVKWIKKHPEININYLNDEGGLFLIKFCVLE